MNWAAIVQLVLVCIAAFALVMPPLSMVLACFLDVATGEFNLSWVGRVTAGSIGIAFLAGLSFFVVTGISIATM